MPVQIPYPYFELEFDAKGQLKDSSQLQALLDGLKNNNTTDVWVISHGWNNDEKDAHLLYQTLFNNVKAQEASVNVAGRTFAVAGVIWPSKSIEKKQEKTKTAAIKEGASPIGKQIDTLEAFLADGPNAAKDKADLEVARSLIPKLETDVGARKQFSDIVLARLPKSVGEEGGWYINSKVGSDMTADDTLLKQLGSPPPKVASSGGGGAAGLGFGHKPAAPTGPTFQGAAGIGDFLKGIAAGASNLLNYVTYYQMKDRAGVVGRNGVNQVVQKIHSALPSVRVHLVGHSFGSRVVTAAATGDAPAPKGFVSSLSLLQGAFSHYAFSQKYDDSGKAGFYRNLIDEARVSGPTIITHTRADDAVGIAYAVASRAMHQIASAMGDRNDPYGGLGSNGAMKTAEAIDGTMPKAGAPFDKPLTKGTMTNLLADGLITSHGDVTNPNAAYAVLSAAAVGN